MQTVKVFTIGFLLSLCAITAHASNPETLLNATYEGSYSGWNLSMKRTLVERSDGTYELKSAASNWFASIVETSHFTFQDNQLRPLYYEYSRRIFGRRVTETIDFDWAAQKAVSRRSDRKKDTTEFELTGNELDPALFQLMLPIHFKSSRDNIAYNFIKRKRVRSYEFGEEGKETFKFNKRELPAIIVGRVTDDDRTTTAWLIPELDYQIGKIVHTDDGDTYQIELAKYFSNAEALEQFYKKAQAAIATEEGSATLEPSAESEEVPLE